MTVEVLAPAAWSPLCMEPDELAAWQEMNGRLIGRSAHAQSPCTDCRLAFAIEMRAIGRCNGSPRGVEEDTEMVETLPRQEPDRWPEPRRARSLELELVTPPCGACVHEPVCELRRSLEGLINVNADAPSLPAGLTLALTASVECSYFLRDKAKAAPVRVLTSQERGQANGAALHRAKREISPEARENMRRAAIAAIERRKAREGAAAG